MSLTKVPVVARLTLIAACGVACGIGCGGQGASDGTGTAAGGAAAAASGAFQAGAGGRSSSPGGATGTSGASGASGGQTSSAGGSGGTMAAAGAGAVAGGAPIGGSSGSGGTLTASGGASAGAGGINAGVGGSGGTTSGAGVSVTITPGSIWKDTQGNVIQAHGEGIIKVGTTYYWLGEDKTNGSAFQNVKCYSSNDLAHWTFVNNVLTRQASGDLGPNRVIERPHVIYNAATSAFVMYMHVDNSSYSDRKAGVATSSSVCGSYDYVGSVKPLGHDSLDDNLFQDGTTGYFLSEDRTNTKLQIYQLSADYLTVASLVATVAQYEAPALAKVGGTYFLFGSHLSGWATNDNQYTTATSLAGPWAAWKSFAPAGTNTCNSQSTFVLPVVGSGSTTYLLLADRWNSNNLTDSRYIWQPLTITGTTVSMTCATSWKIDASSGTWSP
ncbi:MAG: family 43 glycosylhydrolase [Polyangiaceae bacterium]